MATNAGPEGLRHPKAKPKTRLRMTIHYVAARSLDSLRSLGMTMSKRVQPRAAAPSLASTQRPRTNDEGLAFGLFHFFDQWWNDLEQVGDDAVVGDLEDRGFG